MIFTLVQAVAALQPSARRKYQALTASLEDVEQLTRAAIAREKVAEERVHGIERRLAMTRRGQPVGAAKLNEELEVERQEMIAEHDRLNSERNRRNAMRGNCEAVISGLNTAIMTAVGQDKPIHGVPVTVSATPKKGETIGDAVLRVRGEIMRVRAELIALKEAPLPASEVKARVIGEIDRLANQGCPRLDLREGKVKVHWPDVVEFAGPGQVFSAPSGSASKLACWLFRDQLIERLTAGLDHDGIPAAERGPRERDLRAAMLQLELEEESLVVQALAAGLECHRRFDTSPFALLGLVPFDLQPLLAEAAE